MSVVQRDAVPARPAPGDGDASADRGFARFATAMVFAYPLLWVIGIAPGFWIVLGLVAARYLSRVRWRIETRILLLVPLLLLLSLPIGMIRFGADPARILSTVANVCVWLGVAGVVNAVSPDRARTTWLARAFVSVGVVQGLLIAVSARIYPATLPVPLLEGALANAPTGIRVFATNGLYYADWLNGAAFRSQGIMGNATWNGAVGAITVILAAVGVLRWRGRWRVLAVLGVLAGLLSLQTSLSRSTMISLVVAAAAALWISLRARYPGAWAWLTLVGVLLAVGVLVFGLDAVVQQFESINSERAGSAVSRGQIYATTIHYIQQSPFPALGYGLKPKDDGLVASVATHSTYLGIVFRAGFLGAAALLLLLVRGFVLAIRRSSPSALAIMVFVALWCIFEDVDAGHFVPLALAFVFAVGGRVGREPHLVADARGLPATAAAP